MNSHKNVKYCVTNQTNVMAKMLHFYSEYADHVISTGFSWFSNGTQSNYKQAL